MEKFYIYFGKNEKVVDGMTIVTAENKEKAIEKFERLFKNYTIIDIV